MMILRLMCFNAKFLICLILTAFLTATVSAQEETAQEVTAAEETATEETTEDLFPDFDVSEDEENTQDESAQSTEVDDEGITDVPLGRDPNQPMTMEEAIQTGGQLLADGRLTEAVQLFSQVLNQPQGKGNIQALAGRGKAFAELKYYDLALKSFDKVLQQSPNNPYALGERGKVLIEVENFREAIDDFERAVENFPTNPEFLKNYGKALIRFGQKESQMGNFEAGTNISRGVSALGTAIERLERYLNDENFAEERKELVKEELAEARFERGLGNQTIGEFELALSDFETAYELAPDNLRYAEHVGNAYYDSGVRDAFMNPEDSESVISSLTRAISRISETIEKAEAKEQAAAEKTELEDTDDVVTTSEEEPFDPNSVLGMYLRIARSRIELAKQFPEEEREEHYRAALDVCQRSLDRDDQFAEGYLYQGVIYRLLNEYEKAIDAFSETVRLGSTSASEAVFRRGIVWYYLGEYQLALKDFDAVGGDPRAQFWTGVIHLKHEDYTESIDAFTESISLNPRYLLSYINRGIAYLQIADYKRALRDFNEVIRRDPRNSKGYHFRGITYEMTNLLEKAKESFAHADKLKNGEEKTGS